jgi:hypothetical protein
MSHKLDYEPPRPLSGSPLFAYHRRNWALCAVILFGTACALARLKGNRINGPEFYDTVVTWYLPTLPFICMLGFLLPERFRWRDLVLGFGLSFAGCLLLLGICFVMALFAAGMSPLH